MGDLCSLIESARIERVRSARDACTATVEMLARLTAMFGNERLPSLILARRVQPIWRCQTIEHSSGHRGGPDQRVQAR
jgi:hypothetical protein